MDDADNITYSCDKCDIAQLTFIFQYINSGTARYLPAICLR